MKNFLKRSKIYFLFAVLISSSCTTISYTPQVTLDLSPKTIKKSLQIDKFVDLSNPEDKNNPLFGLSATNEESLPAGLALEVTNAFVSDFSINSVFDKVSRRIENPDYILKGEIKTFYGKSELNTYAKISYFGGIACFLAASFSGEPLLLLGSLPIFSWYFGAPVSKNTSKIEITVKLYNSEEELINTYTGKGYSRINSNMYKNKAFAVPSLTNSTFSNAVLNIREQLMNDFEILNN